MTTITTEENDCIIAYEIDCIYKSYDWKKDKKKPILINIMFACLRQNSLLCLFDKNL